MAHAVVAALAPAWSLDAAQRTCCLHAERPDVPVQRTVKSAEAHMADGKAHFAAGRWHEAAGSWLAALDEAGCCAKAGRPAHKETEASAGLAFVCQLLLGSARASQRLLDHQVRPSGHALPSIRCAPVLAKQLPCTPQARRRVMAADRGGLWPETDLR